MSKMKRNERKNLLDFLQGRLIFPVLLIPYEWNGVRLMNQQWIYVVLNRTEKR